MIKHINNKHEDMVYEKVCKKHFKQQKRDAYIKDKDRIENAPIAHSFSTFAATGGNKRPFVPRPKDDVAVSAQGAATAGLTGEPGEVAEPPVKKEYVDYDDPMTTQLREVKKQIAFGALPKQERPQINYDDLF